MQHLAKKAAETVVLVIDEEGISSLMSELLKGVSDNQVLVHKAPSDLQKLLFFVCSEVNLCHLSL